MSGFNFRFLFFVACLLSSGTTFAVPQSTDPDADPALKETSQVDNLPAIPTDISSIVSGGYWEDKQRSGILRVIVINRGHEQVSSRVYIEWLEERIGEPNRRVAYTAVATINDAARWSIGSPVLRPSDTRLVVELPAVEFGSFANRRFVLTIQAQGVGRFELQ